MTAETINDERIESQKLATIINGDCLEVMRTLADCSIDFIVTDPPYGIGFADLKWDKELPKKEIWKEALRICKPGSMMAVFGGVRMHHRLMCSIEDAGWEIRDVMMWLYGQGFPKKMPNFCIPGYSNSLKPAWEPIIIVMKPFKGTYKKNFDIFGLGGMNVDGCRIPRKDFEKNKWCSSFTQDKGLFHMSRIKGRYKLNDGRWPANLVLSEEISKELDCKVDSKPSRFFYCGKEKQTKMPSLHPTQKPIDLIKYIIKLLSPPNDPICLDPFCGSGTTLAAAQELGIRSIGIEISREYFEIAQKRLNQ